MELNIVGSAEEILDFLVQLSGTYSPQLDRIEAKVDTIITQENESVINIQAVLDAVNRETSVDTSVLQFVKQIVSQNTQLSADLKDALANNDPVAIKAVQDALDASVVTMTTNADNIVKAITTVPPPPAV